MNVTTPLTALTVNVPPNVPPAPDWIATVTDAVELVTVFPWASRIATTGDVTRAAPDTPATGWVTIASCVGVAGSTVIATVLVSLSAGPPLSVAVKVTV